MDNPTQPAGYHILPFGTTQDFVRAVFTAHGYSPADAADIADVILRADLYGIESHGIHRASRIPDSSPPVCGATA